MPLTRFRSVVFPAPLGPISPRISTLATPKLTSFRAGAPPKYFVSCSPSRMTSVRRDIRLDRRGGEDHLRTPRGSGVDLARRGPLLVRVEDRLCVLHLPPFGVRHGPGVALLDELPR